MTPEQKHAFNTIFMRMNEINHQIREIRKLPRQIRELKTIITNFTEEIRTGDAFYGDISATDLLQLAQNQLLEKNDKLHIVYGEGGLGRLRKELISLANQLQSLQDNLGQMEKTRRVTFNLNIPPPVQLVSTLRQLANVTKWLNHSTERLSRLTQRLHQTNACILHNVYDTTNQLDTLRSLQERIEAEMKQLSDQVQDLTIKRSHLIKSIKKTFLIDQDGLKKLLQVEALEENDEHFVERIKQDPQFAPASEDQSLSRRSLLFRERINHASSTAENAEERQNSPQASRRAQNFRDRVQRGQNSEFEDDDTEKVHPPDPRVR